MAEPNGKSGQHINNPLTVTENARSPASAKIKKKAKPPFAPWRQIPFGFLSAYSGQRDYKRGSCKQ